MGGSTVKWTSHDPYLVLSESDSKLYTHFEFCEKKNHKHWKNILMYKAKQFMKNKPQESLHILEDGASGVQVDDIEQENV